MVMNVMRRHAKSWLIKFMIAIIGIVFVFYFGYSFTANRGIKIAYVNGEVITGTEYQKAYRDLITAVQMQYKGTWNENMIESMGLRNRALTGLINQRLLTQEATRLGLIVTKDETQKGITALPAFQVNGQFDMRRYRSLLSQNRLEAEDFEAALTQDLLERKLKQFLFAFLHVTDQELWDYYAFIHQKIRISLLEYPINEFRGEVKWDQEGLAKYFEDHRETYRVPEKVAAFYVEIDPAGFRAAVKVKEQEITNFYEENPAMFREPKQVKARHILLKVDERVTPEAEKAIREKGEKILEEARQGKDFATLAKDYSDDVTKNEGGDLGYISEKQTDPTFEKAAFRLKAGEISNLVRTDYGFHIIKVEDVKEEIQRPLDAVRNEIAEALLKKTTTEMAHEKGLSLIDQMPYDVELERFASQHGLQAKKTPPFVEEGPIHGFDAAKGLASSIFSLEKGETTELVEVNEKFFIFQVAERKPSYLPDLKDVMDKVKTDYITFLAGNEAKAKAEKHLQELMQGKDWKEIPQDKNKKIQDLPLFSRQMPIPLIGQAPAISERLFALTQEKPYLPEVYSVERGAFVIRFEERQDIDKKKFEEEKDKLRSVLVDAKHKRAFANWLESLKSRSSIEMVTAVSGGKEQ